MKKTKDILIRDPFVLLEKGVYYMYGTGAAWNGYGCWVSDDLENWEGPYTVFSKPAGHTGDGCWWAPECHRYNGAFYLFATYHDSVTGFRGTAVFKSESPLGPFEQISDGFATPDGYDCIDGTLYVDTDGTPYMVFVQEWTSQPDGVGRMAVARMSDDLTRLVTEPVTVFKATDGKKGMDSKVTDGPFVYRTKSGRLVMLWSNMGREGYAVGLASSNDILGKWRQTNRLLYTSSFSEQGFDGGHGMIFRAKDGRLMLAIHSPNAATDEQKENAAFIEVVDTGTSLMLKTEYEKLGNIGALLNALAAFAARVVSALFGKR
jgi:beta-xylosidase